MPDLNNILILQRKYIFFLLAFFVLGWGFTSYKTIFMGLIFGTVLGLFNSWLLARRVKRFGDMAVQGKRLRSLGMFSRAATAIFGVFIAMEYPHIFHLYSVILGIMTPYIVIIIHYFIQVRYENSGKER